MDFHENAKQSTSSDQHLIAPVENANTLKETTPEGQNVSADVGWKPKPNFSHLSFPEWKEMKKKQREVTFAEEKAIRVKFLIQKLTEDGQDTLTPEILAKALKNMDEQRMTKHPSNDQYGIFAALEAEVMEERKDAEDYLKELKKKEPKYIARRQRAMETEKKRREEVKKLTVEGLLPPEEVQRLKALKLERERRQRERYHKMTPEERYISHQKHRGRLKITDSTTKPVDTLKAFMVKRLNINERKKKRLGMSSQKRPKKVKAVQQDTDLQSEEIEEIENEIEEQLDPLDPYGVVAEMEKEEISKEACYYQEIKTTRTIMKILDKYSEAPKTSAAPTSAKQRKAHKPKYPTIIEEERRSRRMIGSIEKQIGKEKEKEMLNEESQKQSDEQLSTEYNRSPVVDNSVANEMSSSRSPPSQLPPPPPDNDGNSMEVDPPTSTSNDTDSLSSPTELAPVEMTSSITQLYRPNIGGLKNNECKVCGDRADGFHYGAMTCESCTDFFRRYNAKQQTGKCAKNVECEMTVKTRNDCQPCRFKKYLKVAMDWNASKYRKLDTKETKRAMMKRLEEHSEEVAVGSQHLSENQNKMKTFKTPEVSQAHIEHHPDAVKNVQNQEAPEKPTVADCFHLTRNEQGFRQTPMTRRIIAWNKNLTDNEREKQHNPLDPHVVFIGRKKEVTQKPVEETEVEDPLGVLTNMEKNAMRKPKEAKISEASAEVQQSSEVRREEPQNPSENFEEVDAANEHEMCKEPKTSQKSIDHYPDASSYDHSDTHREDPVVDREATEMFEEVDAAETDQMEDLLEGASKIPTKLKNETSTLFEVNYHAETHDEIKAFRKPETPQESHDHQNSDDFLIKSDSSTSIVAPAPVHREISPETVKPSSVQQSTNDQPSTSTSSKLPLEKPPKEKWSVRKLKELLKVIPSENSSKWKTILDSFTKEDRIETSLLDEFLQLVKEEILKDVSKVDVLDICLQLTVLYEFKIPLPDSLIEKISQDSIFQLDDKKLLVFCCNHGKNIGQRNIKKADNLNKFQHELLRMMRNMSKDDKEEYWSNEYILSFVKMDKRKGFSEDQIIQEIEKVKKYIASNDDNSYSTRLKILKATKTAVTRELLFTVSNIFSVDVDSNFVIRKLTAKKKQSEQGTHLKRAVEGTDNSKCGSPDAKRLKVVETAEKKDEDCHTPSVLNDANVPKNTASIPSVSKTSSILIKTGPILISLKKLYSKIAKHHNREMPGALQNAHEQDLELKHWITAFKTTFDKIEDSFGRTPKTEEMGVLAIEIFSIFKTLFFILLESYSSDAPEIGQISEQIEKIDDEKDVTSKIAFEALETIVRIWCFATVKS